MLKEVTKIKTNTFFESLWDAIPYPAFVVSSDNKIISANTSAESYCLISIKQLRSTPIISYFGESSIVLNSINQARDTLGSVTVYDVEVLSSNKVSSIYDLIATPISHLDKNILILFHPHGMSKKIDRGLNHRSTARSVTGMASMLAHEIRNPLAGISGAAQLLMPSIVDTDRELLDVIGNETKRIGKIVDQFQAFGDIRPLKQCPVNIHDILSQGKRAASAGYASNIKIIESYDPSLPFAKGDPDLLLQVVQNLLKNAAEAVPAMNGQILIETAFKQGVKMNFGRSFQESLPLEFSISDNGLGIPDQIKGDIFEPFFTSKRSGSGLGLTLVSKIISDHGGVIEYSRIGERSVFSVLLPIWIERGGAP